VLGLLPRSLRELGNRNGWLRGRLCRCGRLVAGSIALRLLCRHSPSVGPDTPAQDIRRRGTGPSSAPLGGWRRRFSLAAWSAAGAAVRAAANSAPTAVHPCTARPVGAAALRSRAAPGPATSAERRPALLRLQHVPPVIRPTRRG